MFQRSQIGKYRKKEDVLNAKKGKTFKTTQGNEYIFDWKKEGRKYIIIIEWKGHKMQIAEKDFYEASTDVFIDAIKKEIN